MDEVYAFARPSHEDSGSQEEGSELNFSVYSGAPGIFRRFPTPPGIFHRTGYDGDDHNERSSNEASNWKGSLAREGQTGNGYIVVAATSREGDGYSLAVRQDVSRR